MEKRKKGLWRRITAMLLLAGLLLLWGCTDTSPKEKETLAPQKSTGIYDLQGRKLQRRPAKGLFIEDGKLKTR